MNCGIATGPNRVIDLAGLTPAGLWPSRPLHPGRIAARASVGGEFPICTLSVVQRDPSSPIDHVSAKPPSHPGQSAFPSPVVDHSYPRMPFLFPSEA